MTKLSRIAFFAAIKPPDHPIPSGDRLIARNLLHALQLAGFEAELASRYICYSKRSNEERFETRKSGALTEAERLVQHYRSLPADKRPQAWLTYHPYCKAPDWIGPIVSKALDIPYVTIEAARTKQGGPEDEWARWRAEAQAGIKQADLHLVFKPSDREFLLELLGTDERLRDIPTFVDLNHLADPLPVSPPAHWSPDTPVLITTGMMRKGKKDLNFYQLAEIMSGIMDADWNMVLVGGGPEEGNIRTAFADIPDTRLHWTGLVEQKQVLGWMGAGDLFIWPGWKEPIGMVYLEAAFCGLPSIAYRSLGVPLVVEHGETGLLAPEGDISAMQDNLRQLLSDETLRTKMGMAARKKVESQHSLEAGAMALKQALGEIG